MELGGIIKKIWDDPNYKNEFLSDPKKKLEEEGLKVPENVKLIVHENTPDEIHLVIPNKPTGELTDQELELLAGGSLPGDMVKGLMGGLPTDGGNWATGGDLANLPLSGGLVSGGKMPNI